MTKARPKAPATAVQLLANIPPPKEIQERINENRRENCRLRLLLKLAKEVHGSKTKQA